MSIEGEVWKNKRAASKS